MKNYSLSSTFTVLPNNNQEIQNKERYNFLNKNNSSINIENNNNYLKNQKQNYKINNKHKQYNSAMHINNVNHNNKDNRTSRNIDNNVSYQNHSNKELINSKSLNNIEDLDEKLDIKFPYNNKNNNISNSMMSPIKTQENKDLVLNNNNYNINLRNKLFSNNENEKLDLISNKKENYNENFFSTFSKLTDFFQLFHNGTKNDKNNLKNAFIKNKNEKRNMTFGRNMTKKTNNFNGLEENYLKKDNTMNGNRNNNYYLNNSNFFKDYYNNGYNITVQNDANRQNNKYCSRGTSGILIKNKQNEKNDILNFSNNNKQKFSVTKKDLRQFNKNEHYIQKIMDNLPQNNNKNLRNNFNYDHRKHYNHENNYYSRRLNNIDNNVDYYNYSNKNLYNNYYYKELNTKSINNNSSINNENINHSNNNSKTVRTSKYLSMGKQNRPSNHDNDAKHINLKTNNIYSIYNDRFINGYYNNNSTLKKTKKYATIKSAFISLKNKKYSEFIFNISNRKFKHLFISFLDIKTILNLSSSNREFFNNTRDSFYNYFYNKLIIDIHKEKFINNILQSTKKYCSEKIKLQLKKQEMKSFYNKLLKKNEIYDDLILKDIPRTLPNDPNFNKGKINYDKLYNILTCFSNYNKNIGYAQGLNFICAQALYLFSLEEDVFVFLEGFTNIMKMDNIIGVGKEKKMLYKLNEFSKILYKNVPKIIQFFNDKAVSHDFFSTGWILTLFSASMERNNLIVIWCFMIIFRWKFVYSFIIQILKRYERNILNSTEQQLCFKMKNILRQRDFKKDFNEIIKNTIDFMKNNITL